MFHVIRSRETADSMIPLEKTFLSSGNKKYLHFDLKGTLLAASVWMDTFRMYAGNKCIEKDMELL